jgi:predicted aspartyl protease
MSFPFQPHAGLIVVRAELEGPAGNGVLRLALDTGATTTVISAAMMVAVGYDPALAGTRLQVTTGSGVESVPSLAVNKLSSLGHERQSMSILCHTLPPSAGIDGLLGLDFFRGLALLIDFRGGQISVS